MLISKTKSNSIEKAKVVEILKQVKGSKTKKGKYLKPAKDDESSGSESSSGESGSGSSSGGSGSRSSSSSLSDHIAKHDAGHHQHTPSKKVSTKPFKMDKYAERVDKKKEVYVQESDSDSDDTKELK